MRGTKPWEHWPINQPRKKYGKQGKAFQQMWNFFIYVCKCYVKLGQKVEIFEEQEKLVHFTLFKELIICSNNIILIQNNLHTASSLYNIDSTSSPT